ncbi:MAG: lipopolysaccharide assembly protein LapB [Gammaproteobacteria bacterium]|nr:lipopolysaccharide assembly protein LapB [Gammaproteobacteria bacterium]
MMNMSPESTLLLLLLGFILGWLVSKRRSRKLRRQLRFSNDYFQGLNYLLNDEQDKALDIFIQLVEVDWETIDTSLALASIFRRKGEIDKSIKLHQNLLARPSLPVDYKFRVLLELGRDYQLAGWLDRAEGLFNEVLKDDLYEQDALKHLMSIYQQEQDWHNAIRVALLYQKKARDNMRPVIAQFYCELSEQAYEQGDAKEAEALSTQALAVDPNCVRASIMLGQVAIDRGRYKKAIRFLQQVEYQNIDFFPLVLDKLVSCYRNQSNLRALITYLKNTERNHPKLSLVETLTDLINEVYGEQAAQEYLSARMMEHPSLDGLKKVVELNKPAADSAESYLPDVVKQLVEKQSGYQCEHCGYAANTLYWLCPSCHGWGVMKPKEMS